MHLRKISKKICLEKISHQVAKVIPKKSQVPRVLKLIGRTLPYVYRSVEITLKRKRKGN